MKKQFLSIFLFLLVSINSSLFAGIFPVEFGMKYGYIDENLNVRQMPIYDSATQFVDGIAVVKKDGKFHIINEKFETIASIDAKYAGKPNFNRIWFSDGTYKYYTDYNGNFIIGGFDKINNFSEGYAVVEKDGNFYILNLENELKEIPSVVNLYSEFHNGLLCVVNKKNELGFLNTDGEIVIDFQYKSIFHRILTDFNDDLCPVYTKTIVNDYNLSGYIDKQNNFVIPAEYYDNLGFHNGLSCVMYDSVYNGKGKSRTYKWKVIDTENNDIVYFPDGFFIHHYYESGICVYSSNTKLIRYGYIRIDGEIITPAVFELDAPFYFGYANNIYEGQNVLVTEDGRIIYVHEIFGLEPVQAVAWG